LGHRSLQRRSSIQDVTECGFPGTLLPHPHASPCGMSCLKRRSTVDGRPAAPALHELCAPPTSSLPSTPLPRSKSQILSAINQCEQRSASAPTIKGLMKTLETLELQALRGVDEHTALRLQEEIGETFTMFCQKGQELTTKDFANFCRERCLFSLDFTPVDAEILFFQEVPVRSKKMDVKCFKSALARIAQKKGVELEQIFKIVAESGGPIPRAAKHSKTLPLLHISAGRRSALPPLDSPMQSTVHIRRASSISRVATNFRKTSTSQADSEGLTASEALSDEFSDSEKGDQQHVVDLIQLHVSEMSPLLSTRSTEDETDQDQVRCAHKFLAKHRASVTSHLDLYSQLT